MAQAKLKHTGQIIPFPRSAVHRSWAPKRLGQKLNGRRTLFEAIQSDLVMTAHFADFTAGRAMELFKDANFLWEKMDGMHRKLLGFGVEEAANGRARIHGPTCAAEEDGGV